MRPAEREQWILLWLNKRPTESVDVLCSEFVEAYIAETGAHISKIVRGAFIGD